MKYAIALFIALMGILHAAEKPRVFITNSDSWQWKGGARPQTAEIDKTFAASCPDVTITNNRERADFVVTLDHEGGKGWIRRDNKVAVFNKGGDMIFSHSTRELGSAVKEACRAMAH